MLMRYDNNEDFFLCFKARKNLIQLVCGVVYEKAMNSNVPATDDDIKEWIKEYVSVEMPDKERAELFKAGKYYLTKHAKDLVSDKFARKVEEEVNSTPELHITALGHDLSYNDYARKIRVIDENNKLLEEYFREHYPGYYISARIDNESGHISVFSVTKV